MTKKRKSNTSSVRPAFHPSINGFSISNAITMPSEDGYAIYAEVLFDRVTVGEFVDKGDGGIVKKLKLAFEIVITYNFFRSKNLWGVLMYELFN